MRAIWCDPRAKDGLAPSQSTTLRVDLQRASLAWPACLRRIRRNFCYGMNALAVTGFLWMN